MNIRTHHIFCILIFILTGCNSSSVMQILPVQVLQTFGIELQESMLFRAAYNGNISKIKELVHAGLDINAATNHGYTPLHIAVLEDQLEMVHYLLQNGANPLISSLENETALTIAHEKGDQQILTVLMNSLKKVKDTNVETRVDLQSRIVPIEMKTTRFIPGEGDKIECHLITKSNLRTKPNPFADILVEIPKGSIVWVLEKSERSYVKVEYQGQIGYIIILDIDFYEREQFK